MSKGEKGLQIDANTPCTGNTSVANLMQFDSTSAVATNLVVGKRLNRFCTYFCSYTVSFVVACSLYVFRLPVSSPDYLLPDPCF
jgi:hypothetical protein